MMDVPPSTPAAMTPTDSSTPPAGQQPQRKISEPVKKYAQRTLAAEDSYPSISRAEVHAKLAKIITDRLKMGLEFKTDWPTFPLPQEIILQERSNQAARAPPPPAFIPPPPPYLPPHARHLLPPPTNMISAPLPHSYNSAVQPSVEANGPQMGIKRQFQVDRDSVIRSSPFSREVSPRRSATPPPKRPRIRSPSRKSRFEPSGDYVTNGNHSRDDYRGRQNELDKYGEPASRSHRRSRSPPGGKYGEADSRGRRSQDKSGRRSPRLESSLGGSSRISRRRSPSPRNVRNGLEDRITRNGKRSGKGSKKKDSNRKYQDDREALEKRKQRFATDSRKTSQSTTPAQDDSASLKKGRLIGTNMELEKDYFRLTSDPKPELVRPQKVLEKALVLLKAKWNSDHKYNYMKSQLKSMRQDLTVQHIRNRFTIEVYITHARIALEMGDIGEYNQCQTQLQTLHTRLRIRLPTEFIAYQIIYCILLKNTVGVNDILREINDQEKNDEAVKNAVGMHSAFMLGNYYRFFQLYKSAPNLGRHLVDIFIARERLGALALYARVTKYPVRLSLFTNDLAFDTVEEGLAFLQEVLSKAKANLEFSENDKSADGEKLMLLNKTARVLRMVANQVVDIKGQI